METNSTLSTQSDDLVQEAASTSEQLKALESLGRDVHDLDNALAAYRQQIEDSLTPSLGGSRWGRLRISLATTTLFAAVIIFVVITNVLLSYLQASPTQMLQANGVVGVLYVLISLSYLNDLATAKTFARTESDALQLRVSDVIEQFREVLHTRQTWVEECTRAQWICETTKLKTQLVQQELSTKKELLATSSQQLDAIQTQIDAGKEQVQALSREAAANQGQLDSLITQHADLARDLHDQRCAHDLLLEQIGKDKAEQQTLVDRSHELSAEIDAKQDRIENELPQKLLEIENNITKREEALITLEAEFEAYQSKMVALQSELSGVEEAISLQQQTLSEHESLSGIAQAECETLITRQAELKLNVEALELQQLRLSDENTSLSEQVQLGNAAVAELESQKSKVAHAIDEAQKDLESKQAELERVNLAIDATDRKYTSTVALLQSTWAELDVGLANARALNQQQTAQSNLLEEGARQLAAHQSEIDTVEARIADQRAQLATVTAQEQELQTKVDWLLSQIGELERLSHAQVLTADLIAELDASISDRRVMLAAATSQELEVQDRIAELLARETAIHSQHEQQMNEIDALQSKSARLASEVEQLQTLAEECRQSYVKAVDDAREQIGERNYELKAWCEKVSEKEKEFEGLSLKTQTIERVCQQFEDQISRAKNELASIEELTSSANHSLEKLRATEAEAESQAVQLLEKAEALADQIGLRSLQLRDAEAELETLQAEVSQLQSLKSQFDQLSQDSDLLESRLAQQRNESVLLNAQLADQRALEHQLQESIDRLEEQLASARNSLADAQLQIVESQERIDAVNGKIVERETHLQEINNQHSAVSLQLEASRQIDEALRHDILAHEKESGRLVAETERIREELAQLHETLSMQLPLAHVQDEKLKSLESEVQSLAAARDSKQAEYEAVCEAVEELIVRQRETSNRIEQLNAQETTYNQRIDALLSEVEDSQSVAEQWQSYITNLKQETDRLDAEVNQKKKQLDQNDKQLEQQLERFEDVSARARIAKDQLTDLEAQKERGIALLNQLRRDTSLEESNLQQIVAEIRRSEDHSRQLQNEIATLEDTLNECERLARSEREIVDQLRTEQENLYRSTDQLRHQTDELNELAAQARQQKSEIDVQLRNLLDQVTDSRDELTQLTNEKAFVAEEISSDRGLLEKLHIEINDLSDQAHVKRQEIETLSKECAARMSAAESAQASLFELQTQLSQVTSELDSKTTELAECVERYQKQTTENSTLQTQYDDLSQQVHDLSRHEQQLQDRVSQHAFVLETQTEECSQLLSQVTLAEKGLLCLVTEIQSKLDAVSQLNECLESGQKEIQNNKMQLEALRSDITTAEAQHQAQVFESQKLELQLAERIAALESVQQRVERSESKTAELQEALRSLGKQRDQLVEEINAMTIKQAKSQEIEQQLNDYQNRLLDTTAQYEHLHAEKEAWKIRSALYEKRLTSSEQSLKRFRVPKP